MGFDDLARRMRARDGGSLSTSTDPNLMMVEATERAQSSQRSGLILRPLFLVGGILLLGFAVLSLSAASRGSDSKRVPFSSPVTGSAR
jgi:hypothetical protein